MNGDLILFRDHAEASQLELEGARRQVEITQVELNEMRALAEKNRCEVEEQRERADAGQLAFDRLRGTRTFRLYDWFHNQSWLRKMVDCWVTRAGKPTDESR